MHCSKTIYNPTAWCVYIYIYIYIYRRTFYCCACTFFGRFGFTCIYTWLIYMFSDGLFACMDAGTICCIRNISLFAAQAFCKLKTSPSLRKRLHEPATFWILYIVTRSYNHWATRTQVTKQKLKRVLIYDVIHTQHNCMGLGVWISICIL